MHFSATKAIEASMPLLVEHETKPLLAGAEGERFCRA
jgi:hypothetical protein